MYKGSDATVTEEDRNREHAEVDDAETEGTEEENKVEEDHNVKDKKGQFTSAQTFNGAQNDPAEVNMSTSEASIKPTGGGSSCVSQRSTVATVGVDTCATTAGSSKTR